MHAYLIMAHKNIQQLKILLKLLDYKENDIFIHIDATADDEMKNYNYQHCCKCSKVYSKSVIDVKWGDVSQIATEIFLLKFAMRQQKYEYYHLISGMDLPLKSQKEIHHFFYLNKGKEFVNYSGKDKTGNILVNDRAKYYWLTKYYDKLPVKKSRAIMSRIDKMQILFQRLLNINRLKKFEIVKLYHGANWFSITNNLAGELVQNENIILNIYKNSCCCDEVFLQTYIKNNQFFDHLYIPKLDNGFQSIMRNIDWNRGMPYTWREEDFEELINSNYLFARKFDETEDSTIIELISDYILKR